MEGLFKKSLGDARQAQARTPTSTASNPTRGREWDSGHGDPVSDPSVELDLVIKNLIDKQRITPDSVDELRRLLNEVARRDGTEPMCVAAKRAFEVDSPHSQGLVLSVVGLAYPDTPSKIALASQMPASIIRTSAIRGLCANELHGDLKGMQQLYQLMPLGEDRSLVASKMAEVVLSSQGLGAGLDFIANLEMPEERYSALVMLELSNQEGWHEAQDLQKFDKIVDSLLPVHRKLMTRVRP